jgi:hypothetical protein
MLQECFNMSQLLSPDKGLAFICCTPSSNLVIVHNIFFDDIPDLISDIEPPEDPISLITNITNSSCLFI